MAYSTKGYTIETPALVWREFHRLHDDRDRINSRVVELIAEDVQRLSDGDLEPDVEAELNRILGGDGDV